MHKLYAHYESDLTFEKNVRIEYIKKWFVDSLDLLIKENIHKNDLKNMVINSKGSYYLRSGIIELMHLIEKYNIQFYVVSGGIYQLIEETFILSIPNYNSLVEKKLINIIANKFTFSESGYVNGYNDVVFTFNKSIVTKNAINSLLKENINNIIILGDHVNVKITINITIGY